MSTTIQFTFVRPLARLRVEGELDLSTGRRVTEAFASLALRGFTLVELDLAAVGFVDAYSLSLFRREQLRLREAGGDLRVVTASPSYVRVCRLARCQSLLPISA